MAERHRPLTVREIEALRQMISEHDYRQRQSRERRGMFRDGRELLIVTVAVAQLVEMAAFLWHSGTHQGVGLIAHIAAGMMH